MQKFRKTVLLMIPVFIFISLFTSSSFAGGKKWKKHKGDASYSHGHYYDCDLPPGLAKKGKIPPGWDKKCRNQKVKHHAKKHREYYPDHDQTRSSGGHDKPTIERGVDIGVGIHIPFP
jgi:hypothetical protein